MANITAIGKKLKELYPAYAKVGDAQLGQKFILKYGDEGLASLGIETEADKKELTGGQATSLADYDAAIKIIDELGKKIAKGKGLFGPVTGTAGRLDPWAKKEVKKLNSEIRGAVQLVGKAMEGGVLRKEDEAKYRDILPGLSDKYETAVEKAKSVMELLNVQRDAKVQGFMKLGYDIPKKYLGEAEQVAPPGLQQAPQQIPQPQAAPQVGDDRLRRANEALQQSAIGMEQARISPFTQKLAGAQRYLGESQALPTAYGFLGKLIGKNPLATGAGTGIGEWQRQWLQKGGIEGAIPSDVGAIGKKAGGAALLDLILTGPGKVLGRAQRAIGAKSAAVGSGEKMAQKLVERSLDPKIVPLSQQKAVQKLVAERAIPALSGKTFSVNDIIKLKSTAWQKGFTEASKARQSAAAAFERLMGGVLKEELAVTSKAASAIDKILRTGHQAGKVSKLVRRTAPTALLGALGIKSFR